MKRRPSMTCAGLWAMVLVFGSAMAQEHSGVDAITGTGDFHDRLQAIHQLPSNLGRNALKPLFKFLETPTGEPGEAVLKNDLLNALRAQSQPPRKLTQTLRAIYQNKAHSPQIRDYAVQHLGAWHRRTENRESVRSTLWQACDEGESSIAGTALLALLRLNRSGAPIEADRLKRTALKVASQDAHSALSRLSALRVCGELGVSEAGTIAREILKNRHPDVSLQLAAVATLGELGQPADRALLEQLTAHPRLGRAAELALEKLVHKFAQT